MISVIVPARNAAVTIGACLEALLCQEGMRIGVDYEVIVINDGSSDDTAALASTFGVRVVSQANAGPASARNHGAQKARGAVLLFTDADCIPSTGWIKALAECFADPAVAGAKGVYVTRERGLIPRFVQCEYAHKYTRMAGKSQIDFIDTYSAAYRKDIFLDNGGFDTFFPVPSVEDQEFSFRLARKGYKMVFCPQASVAHSHDLSVGEYLKRKFGIGYWKAIMLNWMPEKLFSDSHTPPELRLQILLLGSGMLALLAGLFWSPAWWISLICVLAFIVSSLPFVVFALRYDRAVVLAAPLMLLLRAAALSAGIVCGMLRPPDALPRKGASLLQRLVKRAMDIAGSIVGIVVSAPLILLAGIAIKLDSRGGIFFTQQRAGENGRPFRIIKLRSMYQSNEQPVPGSDDLGKAAVFSMKTPNDPRITRVGRFLRRWSLDELPQFWNVLSGDMSLVGPRPEVLSIVSQYSDVERLRLAMKPGMTGPMQISGRGALDMTERMQLEQDYINNYSLREDIKILVRSIPAVILCKGAY